MVMNFWEEQNKRRKATTLYLSLFALLTITVAVLAEMALRYAAEGSYDPPLPLLGLGFLILTFGVASYQYGMYGQFGGSYVAESIGAYPIEESSHPKAHQLANIVEEMALATGLPKPRTYIIPSEEINAFAAGISKNNAAIAITEGALEKLNRDEVQGVIAHEFGHIYNGDMLISMRLAAMIMGFYFVLFIGLRVLQGGSYRSRGRNEKNPILLIGFALIVAGALSWLIGSILKAVVSRQREYLADASGAQFTRNPLSLANALKKIAKDNVRDMPRSGDAYSHMYLEDHSSIFATHPPIKERIAKLEGKTYEN